MKITLMDNSAFCVPPLFIGAGSERVPLNIAEDGGVQLCFNDDNERERVLRDLFVQTAQDRQSEIIFCGPRPNGYREILHGFQDFDMRLKPSDRTEDWLASEHLMGRQNFSEGKTYSVVFVASMEYLLNDLTYKGPIETRGAAAALSRFLTTASPMLSSGGSTPCSSVIGLASTGTTDRKIEPS